MSSYPRVASFKTAADFRARLSTLGLDLGCDDAILPAPDSPLAAPLEVDGFTVGNRWVIHPMEGWDAGTDGLPTELVKRRWRNFGRSGAKWIWGGEAMAVVPEARANPNQLIINESTRGALASLLDECRAAHRAEVGADDDLLIGFQLTHSGRFSKPNSKKKMEPRILFPHPALNRKFGLDSDYPVLTDGEIRQIIGAIVEAARIAESCGAQFVDIKHCHGYLGHEFLGAHTRPGDYGGSFENRTRYLREIVQGIRGATRALKIGVRLSAFDMRPYKIPGVPEEYDHAERFGFSLHSLDETHRLLTLFRELGIVMVNLTAGSPYYNPHIQRPALFPPSDGYQPPEDPLVGCARQIRAVADLKRQFPDLVLVGSAYTYLQEYLPHVAQWVVREGWADAVGLGRMVLSYPTLPLDTLRAGKTVRGQICRTFSDCTTGPRNGLISGCYPLDPFYKALPEASELKTLKAEKPS
jgi:2,4-dienoyl-CoA reductase-like NADH-dependent reductase (Old Yellow Enzyme family)